MSLEEKIDTSSAAGELISHVFSSISHFERRLIELGLSPTLTTKQLQVGRSTLDRELKFKKE